MKCDWEIIKNGHDGRPEIECGVCSEHFSFVVIAQNPTILDRACPENYPDVPDCLTPKPMPEVPRARPVNTSELPAGYYEANRRDIQELRQCIIDLQERVKKQEERHEV